MHTEPSEQLQSSPTSSSSPLKSIELNFSYHMQNQNKVEVVQALFHGIATDQPPGLGHVEDVKLGGVRVNWNESVAQALQDALISPHNRLVKLSLAANQLTDDTMQWLASGFSNSRDTYNNTLTELKLSENEIGDVGAQQLARILPFFHSMHALDLEENGIGDDGAVALAAVLSQQQQQQNNHHHHHPTTGATLTTLKLGCNRIGDVGVIALIQAIRSHPTLAHWTINRNPNIQLKGYQALIDSIPHLGTVQTLMLGPFVEPRRPTWRNVAAAGARTTTSATTMTTAVIARLMRKLAAGLEQNHVLEHVSLIVYSREYHETTSWQLRQILAEECSNALSERSSFIPRRLRSRSAAELRRELAALSSSLRSDYLGMFEALPVISFFCNLNRRNMRSILLSPSSSLPPSPHDEHHHHHYSTQPSSQIIGLQLWPLILARLQHVPSLVFYMLREKPALTDSSSSTESKKRARQELVINEPDQKRSFVMLPPE